MTIVVWLQTADETADESNDGVTNSYLHFSKQH